MNYTDRSIPIEERWRECCREVLQEEILYQVQNGKLDTDDEGRMIVGNLRDLQLNVPTGLYGEAYEEWRDYADNPDLHDSWLAEAISQLNPSPTFPYKLQLSDWDSVLYVDKHSPYPLYLVRNDFYGDIVCELISQTPEFWYFNYTVKGKPVLKNWKVRKTGSRIIRDATVEELE